MLPRPSHPLLPTALLGVLLPAIAGCDGCGEAPPPPTTSSAPTASTAVVPTASASAAPVVVMPEPRCPPDMVKIKPRATDASALPTYCIDRYEAMLVDQETGARISPYYAPSRKAAKMTARMWEKLRFEMGDPEAQAVPLPTLPAWQIQRDFEPRTVVRKGVTPNGHVSGEQAQVACRHAGKRLCALAEWKTACRGEDDTQFPYGAEYLHRKCNVFREAHPAHILHDNAGVGHSDPRLNKVQFKGRPLLRKTGATPTCVSRWGEDQIYDMVGNLDEWIDDPEGVFAGGFYGRSTKDGCDWRASAHPFHYADYSTGVRCCADLPSPNRPGAR
ncbi:MAG: SUMF1/EgtB/PvdO family nonheme iron enzyme [Deltaproteobacteria bacterium]|nr:SUMF1/EgtB/PvdO family nonheme iron enzyme [Deltaproteobacteria bacterium]